jgi:uncharacterized protein (DUF2236 family)
MQTITNLQVAIFVTETKEKKAKLLHNIVRHIFGSKEQDAQLYITVDPRIIGWVQCSSMEALVHLYQYNIRLKFHIRGSQHLL